MQNDNTIIAESPALATTPQVNFVLLREFRSLEAEDAERAAR